MPRQRFPNLGAHRCHDYPWLVERWHRVAARAGLAMRAFATAGEFKLYCLRTKGLPRTGVTYLSAGIHGDEPGATEALITWAEQNVPRLRREPFMILPCLNPWGLVNNMRTDAKGRDLNRTFQTRATGEISALKRLVAPFRFSLAVLLHEDYDGQGIYIYELMGKEPYWGEALLQGAQGFVPIEGRTLIEGREALNGMVRRELDMAIFKEIGMPEAIHLHLHECDRIFTVETPSEFGLDRRVQAQMAVIDGCLRLARLEAKAERKSFRPTASRRKG